MEKIEVLKRAKKWAFSKGVSPWIFSKNRDLFYGCFSQKSCQKWSFFDILDRKESFLDQKIEVYKKGKKKKWTFYKGVSPWILSINRTFCYRCLLQKLISKRPFRYCGRKIMILRGKIWSFKKCQKWTFFNGVSQWILWKNRTWYCMCFLRKLCQKRSFFDILDRKQGFKDQNTEVLNRAKKWTFSRRVSQWIMS